MHAPKGVNALKETQIIKKRIKKYIQIVLTSFLAAFLINLLSSVVSLLYLERFPRNCLFLLFWGLFGLVGVLGGVLGYYIVPALFMRRRYSAVYIVNRKDSSIKPSGSYALYADESRRRVGNKILGNQFNISKLKGKRQEIEEKVEGLTVGVLMEWLQHDVRQSRFPMSPSGYGKLISLPTRYLQQALPSLKKMRRKKEIDRVKPGSIETDNSYVRLDTPIELPKGMEISKIGKNCIVIQGGHLQVKIHVTCIGIHRTRTQVTNPYFQKMNRITRGIYRPNLEDLFEIHSVVEFQAKTTGFLSRYRIKQLYWDWVEDLSHSLKKFIHWDDQMESLACYPEP